jgi:hypothetical protein
MTTTEVKSKIAEATEQEWFKTIVANFNFAVGEQMSFRGVSAIYEFVNQQVEGWNKITNLPTELQQNITYFTTIRDVIANFTSSYFQQNVNNLNSFWQNQVANPINNLKPKQANVYNSQQQKIVNQPILPYNIPQVDFLLKVYQETPKYFQGAFHFLLRTNQNYQTNIAQPDFFYGAILAYEFLLKDHTEITERRNTEKSSISKIRNDFQKYLSESESQIVEHIKKTNDSYTEYTHKIDELKDEKERLFSEWFVNTKNEQWQNWFENTKNEQWQKWFDPTIKKIAELENTYKEKLKLEEPAKYWSERAQKLKKQAWWVLGAFVFLIIIVCTVLCYVLVNTPKDLLENLFKGNIGGAIKWAIVFTTLISFFAYAIRAVSKVMFSSFHLARDCEERHTLTYFYLSLLKDSKVADSERQLIMQSLFSRADTGLLKEDSSPTMPNDYMSKIIPNK